jgi:hypothetical protein
MNAGLNPASAPAESRGEPSPAKAKLTAVDTTATTTHPQNPSGGAQQPAWHAARVVRRFMDDRLDLDFSAGSRRVKENRFALFSIAALLAPAKSE